MIFILVVVKIGLERDFNSNCLGSDVKDLENKKSILFFMSKLKFLEFKLFENNKERDLRFYFNDREIKRKFGL